MSEKNLDRVNPMRWTDPDTSETYTWDFNRDSIRFAEQRGFKLEDFFDYMNTKSEEFFYYACRMYHKGLSRTQTDALFAKLGGFTDKEWERLTNLYRQAQLSNVILLDEDIEKNRKGTVEMD